MMQGTSPVVKKPGGGGPEGVQEEDGVRGEGPGR